jgi:hypothetical protein
MKYRGKERDWRVETRTSLIHHLLSAAQLFAEQATAIENETGAPSRTAVRDCQSYALGAVMASWAFLEAVLNEFIDQISAGRFGMMAPEQCDRVAELWRDIPEIDRFETLRRYELLLKAVGATSIDYSKDVGQDVAALKGLRNALVHYRVETIVVEGRAESEKPHRLESLLKGRFEPARFSPEPIYPYGCLGGGCARWAAGTAARFATEVSVRLGVGPMAAGLQ